MVLLLLIKDQLLEALAREQMRAAEITLTTSIIMTTSIIIITGIIMTTSIIMTIDNDMITIMTVGILLNNLISNTINIVKALKILINIADIIL